MFALVCQLLEPRRQSNSRYGIIYATHLGEKLWYNPSFPAKELDRPDSPLGGSSLDVSNFSEILCKASASRSSLRVEQVLVNAVAVLSATLWVVIAAILSLLLILDLD